MKNLIIDNIIFSLQKSGGISVVWYELLNRLLKESSLYDKLRFIEYRNAANNIFRKELNLPSEKTEIYGNELLKIKRYFNPYVRCSKEDIFHSSYYRILDGAKNITTVHDFTYEYYMKGVKQKLHVWQKKRAILNSEKIICVSENTRNDLIRFIPEVNPDKIEVVYNGVNEDYYRLSDIVKIKEIPFEKGEYILFVGDRFSEYKQFKLAVEVVKKINRPLVVVGKALTKEETFLLEGVKYQVLTGISSVLLNALYNNAHCLLYPSLYEGFGIPVIEAQKAGCPVIAGANSSIVEVIGEGGIALQQLDVSNITDAIKLLDKANYRNDVIEKGIDNSKRFTWDITYKKTLNIYKSLM